MKGAAKVVVSGRDDRPFWRRVENTPVRDVLLLRGFSGRLDIDWVTRSAGLPERCAKVVKDVVKRSRLWTGERLDTAHELTAHFRDGLDAGRTEDDLVASFGDVKQAAMLIRRSSKRKRPLAWRAWMRAWQAVGCLLALLMVVVGWSMVRYWTATPTISRNYTAELNAEILKVPESERAWPLYREAILMLGELGPEPTFKDEQGRPRTITAKDAEWGEMVAYAERAKPALELIVRGAEKAELGRPYVGLVDPDLARAIDSYIGFEAGFTASNPARPVENPPLIGTHLPELNPLRRIGVLLCDVVAVEAARAGDAAGFERSVSAVIGMAGQLTKRGTLVEQLIGHSMLDLAVQALGTSAREHPGLLGDDAVARLSHRLVKVGLKPTYRLERLMVLDTIQRAYSDDGSGDGVLSRDAFLALRAEIGGLGGPESRGLGSAESVVEMLGPMAAGRGETVRQANEWYDRLEGLFDAPDWLKQSGLMTREIEMRKRSSIGRYRQPVLGMFLPAVESFVWNAKVAAMKRDAVCVGLALEVHKRRHGSYPATLDELVPALLPGVPKDCFGEAPLRYRVMDGRPLVYSVGNDDKDDGGVFKPLETWEQAPDMRLWGW